MRTATVLVSAGFCLASIGCDSQKESCAQRGLHSPIETRTPLERSIAELDLEVLEAVLGDLLTYSGEDSPLTTFQGSLPDEILFAAKAAHYPQTVDKVLYQHQEDLWENLTTTQCIAAREAAEFLVRRTQQLDSFGAFKPQDKRIRIYQDQEAQTEQGSNRWLFDRPVQAWPPGFSKDKRFAVVQLNIPQGRHGAVGTYLLSEDNGKWTVCLRQFVYRL